MTQSLYKTELEFVSEEEILELKFYVIALTVTIINFMKTKQRR